MPRRRTSGLVTLFGACFAPWGRSRMWPMLGFTVYRSRPRKPAMVSALALDSTITRGLATRVLRAGGWDGRPVWSAGDVGHRIGAGQWCGGTALSTPGRSEGRVGGPSNLRDRGRHAPALDHLGAQLGSEGDPQRSEPLRRDRVDAHH